MAGYQYVLVLGFSFYISLGAELFFVKKLFFCYILLSIYSKPLTLQKTKNINIWENLRNGKWLCKKLKNGIR